MFGRKSKRTQKREAHQKALREGLIFWLPGGSSQINVYLDYCVIRCLGKTKMKEKEREIPFTSIRDVIYTPATVSRMASLQLITKEMPDVKRSYWYAYENNLVVVHPGNEELAQKIRQYILNPKGSDVVPPEFLAQLRKERKEERRKAAEAEAQAVQAAKEKLKAEKAAAQAEEAKESQPSPERGNAPDGIAVRGVCHVQGYGRCPIRSSKPSFSSRRMLHPDRRSSSPKSTPKKRAISGRGNW